MNLSTAEKVSSVLFSTDAVERNRSENRDKISKSLNGFPPLDAEAAKKIGLKVNVNWLEAAVIAKQATLQFFNAFCSQTNYFSVQIPSAPPEKKTEWDLLITDCINRTLKQSKAYSNFLDNCFTSVVAHGIAPTIWLFQDKWLPRFVALNDFRVATDTDTSLDNMVWFGIRRRYTLGELVEASKGKYADKGWDQDEVNTILQAYWDKNYEATDFDWSNNPEAMTELVKQNMTYYTSDAVPVITLWHFYHLDSEKPESKKWYMKVVADKSVQKADKSKFIFSSDKPVSKDIDSLLHIQFGDLNGTPPFKFHSVRSLGFMIYEPSYWSNLTRCRALQYVWENFNMLFRGAEGGDKARAQKIELFDKGWIPNDVQIVPKDQRHQIDQGMVELMMSQMKQLMGEASLSYTQKTDTGTQRERTLGEAQIQMQMANALMTGLLAVATRNITFHYREVCKRFCKKGSIDPDARYFQNKARKAGIPVTFLDPKFCDIHPETPLGNGNQTLQMAQAEQLMNVRAQHSPDAQQRILQMYDAAVTQNPRLARSLVPIENGKSFSDGQSWASAIFGTLMQGVPLPIKPELNAIDQIETLLNLASGVIQKITQTDNVGTHEELAGLSMVFSMVHELIQWLAQDPQQKQAVKQFTDMLGQLTNVVKGFASRLAEKSKSENSKLSESISIKFSDLNPDTQNAVLKSIGLPPSQMQPTEPQDVKTAQQLAQAHVKHQQTLEFDQQKFEAEQRRQDMETQAAIERTAMEHGVNQALKPAPEPKAPAAE